MKKSTEKNMTVVILITAVISCVSTKEVEKSISRNYIQNPPLLIYKTKKDYFKNIPIVLTSDKKEIASYPHPIDIFYKNNLAYPTQLVNNYFIDNRGLSVHSVFTNYEYDGFSKLKSVPTEIEFLKNIIDDNPFLELYHCGCRNDYKDEVTTMNQVIRKRLLRNCKSLLSN